MMSDDGISNPSAFPNAVPVEFQWAHEGMTLRDYFAGQILAGDAAGLANTGCPKAIAAVAYDIADAMLIERGKK